MTPGRHFSLLTATLQDQIRNMLSTSISADYSPVKMELRFSILMPGLELTFLLKKAMSSLAQLLYQPILMPIYWERSVLLAREWEIWI